MDPWSSRTEVSNPENGVELEILPTTQTQFDDHFVTSESEQSSFQKLPDSQVYLASLEKKLKTVQSVGPDQKGAILKSLEETRESCMVKLLTDSSRNLGDRPLDSLDFDELKVNPILKKIAPEKQAVALEELVHLIKADELSILLDEEREEGELAKESSEKNDISNHKESNPPE